MTRFENEVEKKVLEALAPELQAEGYEVLIHPRANSLPIFMQGYIPDAIALGEPRNIAFEVTGSETSSLKKIETLRHLFQKEPKWEFRVIYYKPENDSKAVPRTSREAINKTISEIKALIDLNLLRAALLLCWGTFEAISRNLLPKVFERPQTPGRLVENLANRGRITPDDADILRKLVISRNQVIHGNLEVSPSKEDLISFIHVLDRLENYLADLKRSRP